MADKWILVHYLKIEPYLPSASVSCADHCPMDALLEELAEMGDVNALVVGVGECVYYSRKIPFAAGCENWAYALDEREIIFGEADGLSAALAALSCTGHRTVCIFTCIPSLMNLNFDSLAAQFPEVVFLAAPAYTGISPYDSLSELYLRLFGDEEAGGTEDVSVWEFGVLSGADVRKKLRAGTHIVNHPRYLRLLCRLAETAPLTVVDNSRFQSIDYYRRYATPLGVSAAAIDEADRLSSRIARVGWVNVKGASACDFAAFLHSIGVKIGAVVFDGRAYHVHNDSLLRELSGETEVSFDMADTPKNGAVTLDFSVYRDEISERKGLDRLLFMLKRAGELCHL